LISATRIDGANVMPQACARLHTTFSFVAGHPSADMGSIEEICRRSSGSLLHTDDPFLGFILRHKQPNTNNCDWIFKSSLYYALERRIGTILPSRDIAISSMYDNDRVGSRCIVNSGQAMRNLVKTLPMVELRTAIDKLVLYVEDSRKGGYTNQDIKRISDAIGKRDVRNTIISPKFEEKAIVVKLLRTLIIV
jgi:hypothetical protein